MLRPIHTPQRRRRVLLGLAALAVVVPGAMALVPASADQQEAQTVSEGAPIVEKEFPPILAADPVTVTAGEPLTPDECALSPTCSAIPIDIVVPELGEGDDFLVNATIAFDAPTGAEDIDVYFWDDQQTTEAMGSTGYTEVSNAASAENPEAFSVFNPTLGRYNFTVNNFSGVAVTYRLSVDLVVLDFSRPFESLAPTANRGGSNPPPGAAPGPGSPSAPRTAPSSPAARTPTAGATTPTPAVQSGVVAPPTTSPSLATSDLADDADFAAGSFADDSAFDDELAAPVRPVPTEALAFGRDDPPSAASLLLWLVGLPVLVLVAAGGLLSRRNPGMLRALLPRRRPGAPAGA